MKIIGLSVDPLDKHERWADDIEETQGTAPNYPMIADADFNVAKLYGMLPAEIEGDPTERTPADNQTVRNVFVIGPDKKIKLILVYPMTTGRNFDEVLRVIDSLQLTAKHQVVDAGPLEAGRRRHHRRPGLRRGGEGEVPGRLGVTDPLHQDRPAAAVGRGDPADRPPTVPRAASPGVPARRERHHGRWATHVGARRGRLPFLIRCEGRCVRPQHRIEKAPMRVVIAGGHGKIALELTRLLDERGDQVRSLIRNPEHVEEVREAGALEAIVCDLEEADDERVSEAVGEAEAVVFAAGAGPNSGPERKESVDYGGAVKMIEAARHNGIHRFLLISAMGADADHEGEETFDVYLRAKGKADQAVRASGLDWVIIKPGMLTDDPPTGKVEAGASVERGRIPRADVAAVIAALLPTGARERTVELVGGKTPIEKLRGS